MKINMQLLKNKIPQDPQVSSTADEEICKEYDNLPYMVNIQYYLDREQGYWIAEHPELPGCITHGLSREEALSNLEDARKGWLYAVISEGEKPPAPKHTGAPSGKILLRLPKELHQRLLNKAQADNISLNQEILYLLSLGLGQGHMETQIQELAQEIRELKAKYD